jgi:transposase
VTTPSDPLPSDLAAAHAVIIAQRELLMLAKSEVTLAFGEDRMPVSPTQAA